jgi:hypothetical protein
VSKECYKTQTKKVYGPENPHFVLEPLYPEGTGIFTCVDFVDENENGLFNPEEFKDRKSVFYEGERLTIVVSYGAELGGLEGTLVLRNSHGETLDTHSTTFNRDPGYYINGGTVDKWTALVGYGRFTVELWVRGVLVDTADILINPAK